MPLLFPILHILIGLNLTYYVLCRWFNCTRVRVGQGELSVRNGPLPWPGNKVVRTGDLKQLYAKEMVSRDRKGTSSSFEVRAITHSGRNILIVTDLESSEQALFIEQNIEQRLGIENEPVPGAI